MITLKLTCSQCGKEFELSNSEVSYYVTRDMPLPKRCAECRGEVKKAPKKSSSIEYNSPHGGDDTSFDISQVKTEAKVYHRISPRNVLIVLAVIVVVGIGIGCTALNSQKNKVHTFINETALENCFFKYGLDMDFDEFEAYEKAASNVVNNKSAQVKESEQTGETYYYIEITNEFVALSQDGFILRYLKPENGAIYFNALQ